MSQPYGVYLKHPWNFTTFNWKIKSSHRSGWKPIFQAAQKAKSQQSSFAIQKLCQDQPFFWQFELQASDTNRDKQAPKEWAFSTHNPNTRHTRTERNTFHITYTIHICDLISALSMQCFLLSVLFFCSCGTHMTVCRYTAGKLIFLYNGKINPESNTNNSYVIFLKILLWL